MYTHYLYDIKRKRRSSQIDVFELGSATVYILAPLGDYDDSNDTSIVMKVIYGETSFMFTSDAIRVAEVGILEAGYGLSTTVLKVSHHGSDTSTATIL